MIARILGLFVLGLVVAIVVTFSRINLETLRGDLLAILQDATGMPVEIDGAVSWKFSLRPRVELNQVRVANESWATNKYAFSADKIDVRLNLISLFQDKPTIQNVRVYDAEINIEKNLIIFIITFMYIPFRQFFIFINLMLYSFVIGTGSGVTVTF